jgi:hypothetical protein
MGNGLNLRNNKKVNVARKNLNIFLTQVSIAIRRPICFYQSRDADVADASVLSPPHYATSTSIPMADKFTGAV